MNNRLVRGLELPKLTPLQQLYYDQLTDPDSDLFDYHADRIDRVVPGRDDSELFVFFSEFRKTNPGLATSTHLQIMTVVRLWSENGMTPDDHDPYDDYVTYAAETVELGPMNYWPTIKGWSRADGVPVMEPLYNDHATSLNPYALFRR